MSEIKMLDRRTFTLEAVLAILSGVVITISEGCGGSSYPTTPTPTPAPTPTPTGDKVGVISLNHGHTAIIKVAQLTAGGAFDLDIQGMASHTHSVSLSAADIMAIAANRQVARESTNNSNHSHTVTFN